MVITYSLYIYYIIASLCKHKRQRSLCKEGCGGGGICEHKRRRSQCKDCEGGGMCKHNRQRSHCKDCEGGGICEHNLVRSRCKECRAPKRKRDDETELPKLNKRKST